MLKMTVSMLKLPVELLVKTSIYIF